MLEEPGAPWLLFGFQTSVLVVYSRVGAMKNVREDSQLEIQYLPYRSVAGERAILFIILASSLVLSTCAAQLRRHFGEQVASVGDASAQARWR